ncbi:lantibiotic dehydratase [Longimycelium tulufanense]|uniref:Lantibiotic dehydratase n=1 Tax=Longimycelium tulufanense TaxID=907463 RepID=A0A8J3CFL9_9PSEU|nr:lantibiotic dehydratase [Longimycelium tulufanense]GGM71997.1 lantibiotic dehydratase [Longimycelium tulufanense]
MNECRARRCSRVLFRGGDLALLRAPVLPVDGASRNGVSEGGGRPAPPDRELVREALEVASPAAAALLDTAPLVGTRQSRALTRYLVRMSARPTPFGLFVGVAPVSFGDRAHISLGKAHRKVVRPDMGWLRGVTADLERRPEVLCRLRVAVSNLCFRRAGRLVLPFLSATEDGAGATDQRDQELSVRLSPVVAEVVHAAARPIPVPELRAKIRESVPAATEREIDNFLVSLVDKGILVTDLHPRLETDDPLGHVLDRLAGADVREAEALREVRSEIEAYSATEVGAGLPDHRHLTTRMTRLRKAPDQLQVDLALDARVQLPRTVAREVERAATLLWRVAGKEEAPHLRDYREEFLERYGQDRLVLVRELLDPDEGMGPPATYQVPRGDRSAAAPRTNQSARNLVLAEVLGAALAERRHEIVLDDALVDRLCTTSHGRPEAVPPALDVHATLLASSPQALDSGDFTLLFNVAPWGRVAGATMGRFAHVLPESENALADLADRVRDILPGAVDLSWRVRRPREENVARVPARHRRMIGVGTFPADHALDVDDLLVGADGSGFHLVSRCSGQELTPVLGHQLNWELAPNLARFLAEVSWSAVRGWPAWEWGPLETLPFLPRVRYGRTVLAPARWHLPATLRDRDGRNRQDWLDAFDAWRRCWRVPDLVAVAQADQVLPLDLTVPAQRDVLWDEVVRLHRDTLHEVPGGLTRDAHGWLGGTCGAHVGQIVFPLVRRQPTRSGRTTAPDRPSASRPHLPGGDWIYAKLYCSAARQTEILGQQLPALLADVDEHVDRWFFVRYADPEPHLRLRFHGSATDLNRKVLPRLHDWASQVCAARLARRLVLDTYLPETERYGDPATLTLAERVFHTDSVAVVRHLETLEDENTEVVAAATCLHLVRNAHGDAGWEKWALQTFPRSVAGLDWREVADAVGKFVDPSRPGEPGPQVRNDDVVLTAWQRRAVALERYAEGLRSLPDVRADQSRWNNRLESVLHMHCNRILGVSRRLETRAYAIARKILHLQGARRAAGCSTTVPA